MVFSFTVTDKDAPGIGVVTLTFPDGHWVMRDVNLISDKDVKLLAVTDPDPWAPRILVGVLVMCCKVLIDSVSTEELLNYQLWEFGEKMLGDETALLSPVTDADDEFVFVSRSAVFPDYEGMLYEVVVTGQYPKGDEERKELLYALLDNVRWVSPYRKTV